MSLTTPLEFSQTWGSHQPLLLAILEVLKIRSAIECGCGENSTPHLWKAVPSVVVVEHDLAWISRMLVTCPSSKTHRWVARPIRTTTPIPRRELTPEMSADLDKFYRVMVGRIPEMVDLLFVDTYRAARAPAVLHLLPKARMLLLHDMESPSPESYQYHLFQDALKGFHAYHLRPRGVIAFHYKIPWTTLYSREELPLDDLQAVVSRESVKLWGFEVALEVNGGA